MGMDLDPRHRQWERVASAARDRLEERKENKVAAPPVWWQKLVKRFSKEEIRCYTGTQKSLYIPGAELPPLFISQYGERLPQWLKDEIDNDVDKMLVLHWETIEEHRRQSQQLRDKFAASMRARFPPPERS